MKNERTPSSIGRCFAASAIAALSIALPGFAAFAQEDLVDSTSATFREPAQEPIKTAKPVDTTVVDEGHVRPAPILGNPKVQFALLGGVIYKSMDDTGAAYQHQTGESPVGRFGFHYAFFRNKVCNLLLGADLIASKSIARATSPNATATFTTDRVDVGPTVGLGWYPAGPDSAFQFQGLIGTGRNISRTRTLQSPGFSATVPRQYLATDFLAWINVLGVYSITPGWRVMAGVLSFDNVQSFTAGAAYAF